MIRGYVIVNLIRLLFSSSIVAFCLSIALILCLFSLNPMYRFLQHLFAPMTIVYLITAIRMSRQLMKILEEPNSCKLGISLKPRIVFMSCLRLCCTKKVYPLSLQSSKLNQLLKEFSIYVSGLLVELTSTTKALFQ